MLHLAALCCALAACSLHDSTPNDPSCAGPDPTACPVCPDDLSRDDYGTCGGPSYTCDADTGAWMVDGYCEPFPLSVHGDVTLEIVGIVQNPACVTLVLPHVVTLTFVDASSVTAAAPLAVTEGNWNQDGPRFASAHVDLHDGATEIVYELSLAYDGTVTGTGTATDDELGCSEDVVLNGSFTPTFAPGD